MKIKYIVKCKCLDDRNFLSNTYFLGIEEFVKFFNTKSEALDAIVRYENKTGYELVCEIKEVYIITKNKKR